MLSATLLGERIIKNFINTELKPLYYKMAMCNVIYGRSPRMFFFSPIGQRWTRMSVQIWIEIEVEVFRP